MDWNEYDYKAELEIDPNNLDQECLEQAARYMKYAKACTDAQHDMDKAKRSLEVTLSEREMYVRANIGALLKRKGMDDVKVTESVIKSFVDVDPEVKEKYDEFFKRQKDFRYLSNAVAAFDQRKRTITNLVQLAGMGYYAMPDTRPLNREWNRIKQENTAKKVGEELNLKRKKV